MSNPLPKSGDDDGDPLPVLHDEAVLDELDATAVPVLHDDVADDESVSSAATRVMSNETTIHRLAAMTSRAVPRLLVDPAKIATLAIGPRGAFILAHIDGECSMQEILDVCAMPENDALILIDELRAMGIIALD